MEVVRAVSRHGPSARARATSVLDDVSLLALDDQLLDAAATLDAGKLRSLDAIHIAAARQLERELGALVTYDARMTGAALLLGLPVAAPA